MGLLVKVNLVYILWFYDILGCGLNLALAEFPLIFSFVHLQMAQEMRGLFKLGGTNRKTLCRVKHNNSWQFYIRKQAYDQN